MITEAPGAIITDIRTRQRIIPPAVKPSIGGVTLQNERILSPEQVANISPDGHAVAPDQFSRLGKREQELLVIDRMFSKGLVYLEGDDTLVRSRFAEGMPFFPVLVDNSNLIDLYVGIETFMGTRQIRGIFLQCQLACDEDPVEQTYYDSPVNLAKRANIYVPPLPLYYEQIYSTSNGKGKRDLLERKAVLELVWDSEKQAPDAMEPYITERFLSDIDLQYALNAAHRFSWNKDAAKARDELIQKYREEIAKTLCAPLEESSLAAD